MPTIEHTVIMASAGSGKTYALNSRLIALLALGQPAERILALTFTKAAAGEIFDELITRLALAATKPAKTQEENGRLRDTGIPECTPARYAELLRTVIRGLHVSRIGTLDSFFASVVRAFPLELGIAANYAIMDDHVATVTRDRILRRLLALPRDEREVQARRAFSDAFRQATFNEEGKSVFDMLHGFVEDRHKFLLREPDLERWGNPAVIWAPNASPWLGPILDAQQLATTTAALMQALRPMSNTQTATWTEFCSVARDFSMARLTSKAPARTFIEQKLLPVAADLESGTATIKVARQDMVLNATACGYVLSLLRHITGNYLRTKLECTQGLAGVLQRYEDEYERVARRAGRLAFADLTYLINRSALWSGAPGNQDGTNRRVDVDYRLDGQYDHWALDEFQDTSREQWAAVRNLVDEVAQDTSGQRTFFMVGDVKQAIYGWRGGDSRLMGEIAQYYELVEQPLDVSWRSCPDVLAAVNSVFKSIAGNGDLPDAVRAEWSQLWRQHEPAPPVAKKAGCSLVLETEKEDVEHATPIAELLRQTSPWTRGLEAAVLVRANKYGMELTQALRASDIPAVWESDKTIAGHPLVAAILALFRYATHPGDTMAREHLRMSRLNELIADSRFSLSGFLDNVYSQGFAGVTNSLLRDLAARGVPTDAPEIRTFVSSAEAFDAGGSRDCLEFVRFIESFTAKDAPPAGCVRVMTIHHSKGLGFDIVILPFHEFKGITSLDTQEMLYRERETPDSVEAGLGGSRRLDWLLDEPGFVAKHDPTLSTALTAQMERDCFEALCVLYVAMTRAKRGLYVFVPALPKKGEAVHLQNLVRDGLASDVKGEPAELGGVKVKRLYRQGDESWYTQSTPAEPEPAGAPVRLPEDGAAVPRYARRLPSRAASETVPGAFLFRAPGAGFGAEFGTAMHALCAQLEWFDSEPADEILRRWRKQSDVPQELSAAVEAQFRNALGAPEVQRALRNPGGGKIELWRERSFDVILDGDWVTGTFDRVVVTRDAAGKLTGIEVLDFKSDNVRGEAELNRAAAGYRPQIELYRRALAQAFGVSPARVQASLLFTGPGRRMPVE